MDKEISLARQEEDGQSMLLAGSGSGVSGNSSSYREARQKATDNAKGAEGRKASPAKKKSKGNAKAKGRGGKRGRKRGRTYSLRESVRDVEGSNRPSGRSAKELGIEWLGDRCEDSPTTKAHWLVERTRIDNGTIFQCKFCKKVKWLPNTIGECSRLNRFLQVYGLNGGYQRMLDLHPAAKRMMSKIQDIYYLRKSIPAEQFPVAVAAVMLDREYPHDVEITEEEVL